LRLTPPAEGFPWDDLRKIFRGCQWIAKVPNGVEMLPKISTGLVGCSGARTLQTDGQKQTDRRQHITNMNALRKKSPYGHHHTNLSGYIFATKAHIDNRKISKQ